MLPPADAKAVSIVSNLELVGPTIIIQEFCKGFSPIDSAGLFLCIKYRHKSGMIYGYARVSTDGQSVEAQVRQLAKAGCSKVFREVASGAKTDRTQLRKALDRIIIALP